VNSSSAAKLRILRVDHLDRRRRLGEVSGVREDVLAALQAPEDARL
jgi:hypothetical protein